MRPWTAAADNLIVTVRLTPKGGRDALDGIEVLADGREVVRARVRAVPAGGAANAALVKLLAAALDVAPRDVSVVAGVTARIKRIKIAGNGAALGAALARLTG